MKRAATSARARRASAPPISRGPDVPEQGCLVAPVATTRSAQHEADLEGALRKVTTLNWGNLAPLASFFAIGQWFLNPKRVTFVDSLPTTAVGKVSRRMSRRWSNDRRIAG